jgi:hypothetical protein
VKGLLTLPIPPTTKAQGRVHRIRDDDEAPQQTCANGHTLPDTIPFIAADATGQLITAKGSAMPKGVYDRTKKDESANDAAPPQKRTYRKKAALVVAKPKTNGAHAVAAFGASLDLRSGAVTINAASGSLSLAPDEVLALLGFLRGPR